MKLNVAIIMGGYSNEFEISLQSGEMVYQTLLNSEFYKPYKVHIFKEKWVYVDANGKETIINKSDFSVRLPDTTLKFNCVFNAIHGSPGEDGLIQAYFNLLNIPHSSCDMYQAALTYNKRDLLAVLKPYGITMAKSYYFNLGDTINENDIVNCVGLPCFVKANRAGSSFGVSKAYTKSDLKPAIEKALKEDTEVIIEAFIEGTEISVGVISYQNQIKVLPITEIVSKNDFFDYAAKYLGQSDEITPARIPDELTHKVNKIAKRIYKLLKLKGYSRSEYIIKNGEPYLIEINTIPGLTAESILPKQAKAAGISLLALFESAIKKVL